MRPEIVRLPLWLMFGGLVTLFLTGIRFDGLPFIPNAAFSDAVIAHFPNALFLHQSVLEDGVFPLWQDTIMAGQPFAANPLNKTAYPLQWFVLLFPPTVHLNLMIVLHLLVAGWGMWIWARALDLRPEAAAFAVFAYAFSPRLMAHLGAGHLDVLYAMAWFPWLLWSIHCVLTTPDGSKRFSVAVIRPILFTALFASLLVLADVRVSLFALAAAAVYAIYYMVRFNQIRRGISFVVAGMPFLVMTLSLTAPLLGWRPYLSRAELTIEDASFLSMQITDFVGIILPPHGTQHEQLTYFGLAPLLLAIAALLFERGQNRLLWLVALVGTVLYALGSNSALWTLAVRAMPSLLWFRVPARGWLILTLLIPLLAGFGFQYLLAWIENGKGISSQKLYGLRLAIPAGIMFALVIGAFAVVSIPTLAKGGIALAVIGTLLGFTFLLFVNQRLQTKGLVLLFASILIMDGAWTAKQWVEWRGTEAWLAPQQALAEELLNLEAQRIYSPTYSLEQQTAAVYGLRLFGGIDPFQLTGIVSAIEQGSGVPVNRYSVILPPLESDSLAEANQDAVINTSILGQWRVSHVVAAYPIDHPLLREVNIINGVYVYENTDQIAILNNMGWAQGWAELPDENQVTALNQLTLNTALISGISIILCIGTLILMRSHG